MAQQNNQNPSQQQREQQQREQQQRERQQREQRQNQQGQKHGMPGQKPSYGSDKENDGRNNDRE
jgi:hypothetical protein